MSFVSLFSSRLLLNGRIEYRNLTKGENAPRTITVIVVGKCEHVLLGEAGRHAEVLCASVVDLV